jgi:hypothetical protein
MTSYRFSDRASPLPARSRGEGHRDSEGRRSYTPFKPPTAMVRIDLEENLEPVMPDQSDNQQSSAEDAQHSLAPETPWQIAQRTLRSPGTIILANGDLVHKITCT